MKRILPLIALVVVGLQTRADEPKKLIGVAYGKHPRQVLDFYQAKSDKPTPVVFHIHGGGWQDGDKKMNPKAFLDKGISVVAINYRYVKNGVEDKVEPPVKAPLEDAARALQFVRSKAGEWNIDKKRIGATGGSAGACSSLWLAFHDDMADPKSDDPIARESTRLYCAAVNGARSRSIPKELREWMPNYSYGAHAFGLPNFQSLIDNREKVLKWIKEYSPIEHVSKDDPPIAPVLRRREARRRRLAEGPDALGHHGHQAGGAAEGRRRGRRSRPSGSDPSDVQELHGVFDRSAAQVADSCVRGWTRGADFPIRPSRGWTKMQSLRASGGLGNPPHGILHALGVRESRQPGYRGDPRGPRLRQTLQVSPNVPATRESSAFQPAVWLKKVSRA